MSDFHKVVDAWNALQARGRLEKMTPADRAELVRALDAQAVLHGNDFAIVAPPDGGCAIIDLHSPLLQWGAFDFTLEEATALLAMPGAVEAIRAYIGEQRNLLPFE